MVQKKSFLQFRTGLLNFFMVACLFYQASAVQVAQASEGGPVPLADDPTRPSSPVRLIFIHHSTGENWLADDNGGLGLSLSKNNYFVSDTNYGWGPDSIGDRTDIPNWTEWFRGSSTPTYMAALYGENEQHSSYTRSLSNPGGENKIIMFKSCFPNSDLEGNPNDPPSPEGWLTVGHAKYVYNQLLIYFKAHPDKLFVVITAPPLSDSTHAANARAFNQWLVNTWLDVNNYSLKNVAVFDFYNVLTSNGGNSNTNDLGKTTGNHHRWWSGAVQHKTDGGSNTNAYPSGDDHPSRTGNLKATGEFLPMLNIFYNRWKNSLSPLVISGNVGASGAALKYVDGTAKTVYADANGNYSLTVPTHWSGKVTPSKTGVPSFTPADRTYVNLAANQTNQNYKANTRVMFVSVYAQDGYIRESTETSGVGGAFNASRTYFIVGDDALRRQYRGLLSFNTASLPDNAVLVSAKLKITKQGLSGVDPMTSLGSLRVDIRKPFYGSSAALGLEDFNAASGLSSSTGVGIVPVGNVYTANFPTTAFSYFNKTGQTQLRLRFQLDDNNNGTADSLSFYSGNSTTTAYRPVLEIIYHLP